MELIWLVTVVVLVSLAALTVASPVTADGDLA
jgi:hypothetical protein